MWWAEHLESQASRLSRALAIASWLLSTSTLAAYTLDVSSQDSAKSVAAGLADDMMSFYTGTQPGQTPGLLPAPYFWWEAGAMMGTLIDYWHFTGDTKWNNITREALLFQTGPDSNYMPPNQTLTEGNDDQGFWAMAVMSAAEYNFDNPPADQPQWLALAQAVFDTQVARWDAATCGGGLRWQIFTFNQGFDYKNSISQACMFNLAARLALYTGNITYSDWANKVWDWMVDVQFLPLDTYYVFDGASVESNCTSITGFQWTYTAGAFLHGAAAMYNLSTGNTQAQWRERVQGLSNGTQVFFVGDNNNIMQEIACEPVDLCDTDQQSFKAYLARWMAASTQWAPFVFDQVKPLLDASAQAAVAQCHGGSNGKMCGLKWTDNNGTWDGTSGVGQQMAAMEVVLATMVQNARAPVTNRTGGTSQGSVDTGSSGLGSSGSSSTGALSTAGGGLTAADRFGAALLTFLALSGLAATLFFLLDDEIECKSMRHRWAGLRRDFTPAPGESGRAMLRHMALRSEPSWLPPKIEKQPSSIGGPGKKRRWPLNRRRRGADSIVVQDTFVVNDEKPLMKVPSAPDWPLPMMTKPMSEKDSSDVPTVRISVLVRDGLPELPNERWNLTSWFIDDFSIPASTPEEKPQPQRISQLDRALKRQSKRQQKAQPPLPPLKTRRLSQPAMPTVRVRSSTIKDKRLSLSDRKSKITRASLMKPLPVLSGLSDPD